MTTESKSIPQILPVAKQMLKLKVLHTSIGKRESGGPLEQIGAICTPLAPMTILENLPRMGGPITKTLPMDGLLNHSEHAVKRNA